MNSDEEDYVFFGTPIEREEEFTSRKKKAVAEASGNLRTLPSWKQEVTDEEGRRRFHGAFTGGYSAGYYNTVGSKEGWAPQAFTSSRKTRAEVKQQSISDFLDEDEKAEMEGQSLGTSSQFDTFGFTAAEHARQQAEREQHQRPSAIPGPVPDEIVLPVMESVGVKLLLKMGWRRGHSVKDLRADSQYDARRKARKAFLAFSAGDTTIQSSNLELGDGEHDNSIGLPDDDVQFSQSTPVYVLNPKQDLYGLGYDPYRHAPEFQQKKKLRSSASREPGNRKTLSIKESIFNHKSGKVAPGFGIGALEELDDEDEDVYASGYDFEETYVKEEEEEPPNLTIENRPRLLGKEHGVLAGFRVASKSEHQLERFDPPVIPKDFVPRHSFSGPLETNNKLALLAPPEVPPPDDNNLKVLIEGVATLVARSGKLFEDLSREKNQSNPLFNFLSGGNGHDYYERKLWEERQKRKNQTVHDIDGKSSPRTKMNAETRGRLLGERPLESTSKDASSSIPSESTYQFQVDLSDAFTKPATFNESVEVVRPFKDDPAKQERFEQFLKQKYQGGLRSTGSSGANSMSEAARARERLDFEAAAEAIEKGKLHKEGKPSNQLSLDKFSSGGTQLTSGALELVKDFQAEDLTMKMIYPQREEFQWRPSPLLCKRFDITDPHMGKPLAAPRRRSKMDALIFLPDSVKATGVEEIVSLNGGSSLGTKADAQDQVAAKDEVEVEVENVERPVDLYKAIFSDDSEDEVELFNAKKTEDPERKSEAAASTLNRLIAGDFLESLGKELGLEVPPDVPYAGIKPAPPDMGAKANIPDTNIPPTENKSASILKRMEAGLSGNGSGRVQGETMSRGSRKDESPSRFRRDLRSLPESDEEKSGKKRNKSSSHRIRQGLSSSGSSEDERSRKPSRRQRHKSSDRYSDSSSDRHKSSSKRRSSRQKSSSSSKHSRHHKHRSRNSPSQTSRYSSDEERGKSRRDKRKRRD